MLKETRRKERRQFKFLNVKLLHNQSADNYVGLFMKLLEVDYVVDTSNNRQVELLDFVKSQTKGVYVGKIATYMRSSNVKWFDNETKQRTIGPQISENLRPNLKEDFFYLVPERHRIAIPSSSEVSINSLKLKSSSYASTGLSNLSVLSSYLKSGNSFSIYEIPFGIILQILYI